MKQLFSSIKHCHDNVIKYRYIKWENITVSDINDFNINLIDLGISKKLKRNEMCSKKMGIFIILLLTL